MIAWRSMITFDDVYSCLVSLYRWSIIGQSGWLVTLGMLLLPLHQVRQHFPGSLAIADKIVIDEIDCRGMCLLAAHGIELGSNLLRRLRSLTRVSRCLCETPGAGIGIIFCNHEKRWWGIHKI